MQVSFRWNSSELHFNLGLGFSLVCETRGLSYTIKTKMYFISHNVPPCGQVLLRRTGIPISLSVLYMTLARKLGVPLEPVNFPNHFLLRWCQNQRRWAFNTFYCSLSEWNYIANTSKFQCQIYCYSSVYNAHCYRNHDVSVYDIFTSHCHIYSCELIQFTFYNDTSNQAVEMCFIVAYVLPCVCICR